MYNYNTTMQQAVPLGSAIYHDISREHTIIYSYEERQQCIYMKLGLWNSHIHSWETQYRNGNCVMLKTPRLYIVFLQQ